MPAFLCTACLISDVADGRSPDAAGNQSAANLIAQQTDHASHGDACGAQGAGHLLMGQPQIETESIISGLAIVLDQHFKKTANPFLNATQAE